MQFITTKTPTTLTALTHQVFAIHGAKSTAAAKHAQAALRAANPHWGEHTKLPAGTLVIVPDVSGLQAAASQPAVVIGPTVVEQLKQALAGAQAMLENSVVSETQEIKTSLSLAKSRELIASVKEEPELRDRLAQVNEESKLQLAQIATAKADMLQGLAQLGKDLESLNS